MSERRQKEGQEIVKKTDKKNLICALEALLAVIAYILIDGLGIIISGFRFISSNNGNGNTSVAQTMRSFGEKYLSGSGKSGILMSMRDTYIARLAILVIILFPIVFVMIRYRISFKSKDKEAERLKQLIPILRPVFGFIFFYYILTINTLFGHELFTNFYSFGHWISLLRIVGAFAVLGASILDWPVFIQAVKSFPKAHPKLYKAVFVLGISVCSCMLVEYQIGSKMNMTTYMLFYNVLYWLILQVFIDVITRNVKIGAFVSLILSYLVGLVNDVVYQFRGNYVMFGDLTVVRTALEVAGKYTYKPYFWFWLSLAILIVSIAVTIILKFPKHDKPNVKEIAVRAGISAAIVACVIVTFGNGMIYHNVFGTGWDYNTNVKHTGYISYFLSNMNSIKKVTLEGYDVKLADEAFDRVTERKATVSSPNIIIIQNEAFADLSIPYDIKTNQDYMPFIRSLTKNTRKGYLNMSLTGGPTANTEFEILLRSTLGFLPYGSVPYTQYVNSDLPSVPQVLKNQPTPYHTVAYHPYYTSGYRRSEVYNHFGFDEIHFEDDFKTAHPQSDIIRDYLSDSADYKRVESMYEEWRKTSDAPWFCFNVTIQNHGGYTQAYKPSEADKVYVTNFEATDSINNYLSLIKVSDNAFKELIEYFENCKEPTIIAMYGDHQPSFDNKAVEILEGHVNTNGAGDYGKYYVPYVIWANFDIEEEDTSGKLNTLSTNYFASTVFDVAGVKLSDYDRYLLYMHDRLPAVTAIGIWDKEGNQYSTPKAAPYSDDLIRLQMIQYNLIFDDNKRLRDRFLK